jgi:hypothetical protein
MSEADGRADDPKPPDGDKTSAKDRARAAPDEVAADWKLRSAERYLNLAAKRGVEIKAELAAVIAEASDAHAQNAWTPEVEKRFLAAYDELSNAVMPVRKIVSAVNRDETAVTETEAAMPDVAVAEEAPFVETDETLKTLLVKAELLIAHAAESGLKLESELVDVIESAREDFGHKPWTQIAKKFWPAYGQLCALVKPVTAESLLASSGKELKGVLASYRLRAIWLAGIILPLSVVMFINTSISNDVSDRIKEDNALAINLRESLLALSPASVSQAGGAQTAPPVPMLSGRKPTERDAVTGLQEFATANRILYARANLLNHFVMNAEHDPFEGWSSDDRHKVLELPPKLDDIPGAGFDKIGAYQLVRAYAKNVQQMNLVLYGAVTAYFLPILYALLGAYAYALRALSEQTTARTYHPSYAAFARTIIALIAGLVVGLFSNFTQGISLSPLAIAFLVGYAVEIFFSFLDAFLETLKKIRT